MGREIVEGDKMNDYTVHAHKVKTGELHDYYQCSGCDRRWKVTSNKIGHSHSACLKKQEEQYRDYQRTYCGGKNF